MLPTSTPGFSQCSDEEETWQVPKSLGPKGRGGSMQSSQQGGTAQRKAQAPWISVEIGTPLVVRVLAFFRSLELKSSMQAGNTVYNVDQRPFSSSQPAARTPSFSQLAASAPLLLRYPLLLLSPYKFQFHSIVIQTRIELGCFLRFQKVVSIHRNNRIGIVIISIP